MSTIKRICIVLCAAVLAFSLAACDMGGAGQQGSKGFAPRDYAELDAAATDAIEQAAGVQEAADLAAQKGIEADKANEHFALGNDAYKEGDYKKAIGEYEAALEASPLHKAANVNITLAYLQVGMDEEALMQSLKCVFLFSDDPGCLLNAQVAATACKFRAADIEEALDSVLRASESSYMVNNALSTSNTSGNMRECYEYNELWNRIETAQYAAIHPGESAYSEETIDEIVEELEYLEGRLYNDEDVTYLKAYAESVASELDAG